MKYIADTTEFHIDVPTVVTLGKFDGRHRGHQKLMRKMMEIKAGLGYETAVFTFSVTPAVMVTGQRQPVLTTNLERRNNLKKTGIDWLVEYPFTEETKHMQPEEFVREVLVNRMNARAIVVGTDCGFGYRRSGNAQVLTELSGKYGYQLYVIEKEKDDRRDISSTYIREELEKGNVEKANRLLGEPYAIHGTVVHGRHMGGSVLGFPTANLIPPEIKLLPRFGVYVSRVLVDRRYYRGVTNIGRKPTIDGENPVGVETFIFDLEQNIYGHVIEVQLLSFIRPERPFASLGELKEQIGRDKETAAGYFEQNRDMAKAGAE